MEWLDFSQRPAAVNFGVFAFAAAAVWFAGSRLAVIANRLASASGLGQALVGMVVLAALSSLPETAVTLSAAVADTPHLAVSNVLGSIAVQITLLAVGDALIGRDALLAAIYVVGLLERRDGTIARMGIDSPAMLACYSGGLALLYRLR